MSPKRFLTLAIWRVQAILTRLNLKFGGRTWSEGIQDALGPDPTKVFAILETRSLRKFQTDIVFVPGMLSPDECLAVFYASAFSGLRGDIVEIGSWLGRSTLHLAKGCMLSENGIVNAVDTFVGNAGYLKLYQKPLKDNETIFEAFQRNIRTAGLANFVQAHCMKSEIARKSFTQPVRMIFIDGCHEYDAVKRDIATWKDLLLPDGLLLLHDFRAEAPGSIKAIRESVLDSSEFKLVALIDSLLIAQKI